MGEVIREKLTTRCANPALQKMMDKYNEKMDSAVLLAERKMTQGRDPIEETRPNKVVLRIDGWDLLAS